MLEPGLNSSILLAALWIIGATVIAICPRKYHPPGALLLLVFLIVLLPLVWIDKITYPKATSGDLIFIGRTNTTFCCANFFGTKETFSTMIELPMKRKNNVRLVANF